MTPAFVQSCIILPTLRRWDKSAAIQELFSFLGIGTKQEGSIRNSFAVSESVGRWGVGKNWFKELISRVANCFVLNMLEINCQIKPVLSGLIPTLLICFELSYPLGKICKMGPPEIDGIGFFSLSLSLTHTRAHTHTLSLICVDVFYTNFFFAKPIIRLWLAKTPFFSAMLFLLIETFCWLSFVWDFRIYSFNSFDSVGYVGGAVRTTLNQCSRQDINSM